MAKKREGEGMTVALVASEFNYDVTYLMVERAREELEFLGAQAGPLVKTPGVFDMPLAVDALLARPGIDAVVTLGAVIEGETDHDEVVMGQAARKLADLMVQYHKPVGLGISGPARRASRPRTVSRTRRTPFGPS